MNAASFENAKVAELALDVNVQEKLLEFGFVLVILLKDLAWYRSDDEILGQFALLDQEIGLTESAIEKSVVSTLLVVNSCSGDRLMGARGATGHEH